MKLYSYIHSMDDAALSEYAERCGTTPSYLKTHVKHARKIPRPGLFEKLHQESQGNVTEKDVFEHFYLQSNEESEDNAA